MRLAQVFISLGWSVVHATPEAEVSAPTMTIATATRTPQRWWREGSGVTRIAIPYSVRPDPGFPTQTGERVAG